MTRKVLPIAAVLLLAACVDTPSTRCGANFCADVIRDTAGVALGAGLATAKINPVINATIKP